MAEVFGNNVSSNKVYRELRRILQYWNESNKTQEDIDRIDAQYDYHFGDIIDFDDVQDNNARILLKIVLDFCRSVTTATPNIIIPSKRFLLDNENAELAQPPPMPHNPDEVHTIPHGGGLIPYTMKGEMCRSLYLPL